MTATQATPAKRRVRLTRQRKEQISGGTVKVLLDGITGRMRDLQATINASVREMAKLDKQALEAMQAAKLAKHSCAEGDLEVKVSSGRSSTYIDPEKYHDAVGDDEAFYGSVKVTMAEARRNLSGKEFDAIAEVTPGKPGKPVLKTEFYYPEGAKSDD
jgi:hypothetical protein